MLSKGTTSFLVGIFSFTASGLWGVAPALGKTEEQLFNAAQREFDRASSTGVGAGIPEEGLSIQGIKARCFAWDYEFGYTIDAAENLGVQKVVVEDPVLHMELSYWTFNGPRVTDVGTGDFGHVYRRQLGPAFYIVDQLILKRAANGSAASWWTRYSHWFESSREMRKRKYCYYQ